MTIEALENTDSKSELELLEEEVKELEKTVNDFENNGVFDDLLKEQLRAKLQTKREELAVKSLESF